MASYKWSAFSVLAKFRKSLLNSKTLKRAELFIRPHIKFSYRSRSTKYADNCQRKTHWTIGMVGGVAGGAAVLAIPAFLVLKNPTGDPVHSLVELSIAKLKEGNRKAAYTLIPFASRLSQKLMLEGDISEEDNIKNQIIIGDHLSTVLINDGRFEDAESNCKQTLDLGYTNGKEESDIEMIALELQLSLVYCMTNRYEDAVNLQKQCIQKITKDSVTNLITNDFKNMLRLETTDVILLMFLGQAYHYYACTLLRKGEIKLAETIFNNIYNICRTGDGENHSASIKALAALVFCKKKQEEFTSTKAMLEKGIKTGEKINNARDEAELLARLVIVYHYSKTNREAEALFKSSLALTETFVTPDTDLMKVFEECESRLSRIVDAVAEVQCHCHCDSGLCLGIQTFNCIMMDEMPFKDCFADFIVP